MLRNKIKVDAEHFFSVVIQYVHSSSNESVFTTDKETDESWDVFIIFWAGLGSRAVLVKTKFGADYEQLLRPVFLCLHGQKIDLIFFENIVASALKSCIE